MEVACTEVACTEVGLNASLTAMKTTTIMTEHAAPPFKPIDGPGPPRIKWAELVVRAIVTVFTLSLIIVAGTYFFGFLGRQIAH